MGGYFDNSIKIFDLEVKPGKHHLHTITDHKARVTCLRFSSDYQNLVTCDSDGVILHYDRPKRLSQKEAQRPFPYLQRYKV